jgi:hypothetical protein
MPISSHLLQKLQQALGATAAEDLVSWIEGSESVKADLAELRHEMQLGFSRIDARFERIEARFIAIDGRFVAIDGRFEQLRLDLEKTIEKRFADLLKWSFVFWVGAVAAIAALAGVLR